MLVARSRIEDAGRPPVSGRSNLGMVDLSHRSEMAGAVADIVIVRTIYVGPRIRIVTNQDVLLRRVCHTHPNEQM